MKTPDEIKKGLELCSNGDMRTCLKCPYPIGFECFEQPMKDALAYIQQLESRLAQAERERDALLREVGISCDYCAYADNPFGESPCMTLEEYELGKLCSGWKWRGVCEGENV